MKDSVQLFIDQRGHDLRALLTGSGQVLASTIIPGPLESAGTLQSLIAELVAKSGGRKPEQAHLLIAADQVKFSTFRLQEMPRADVEKIVQRSMTTTTGEKEPIFRLTPLAPEQDKDVFLAEQIPCETVTRLLQLFADAHLRLGSVSSALQANLAAFAPHRDSILQAQAIFDISQESVTAIFISPVEILHQETVALREGDRETEISAEADAGRALKRRLFTILNVIHGLYSQYMLANPLLPVEKVWLCGSEAEIAGLEDSLVDAMDVEVAPLDLLAGQMAESRAFTPLAGLIHHWNQPGYVNFIPVEITSPTRASSRSLTLAGGGFIALLLVALGITSYLGIHRLQERLGKERSELKLLQATAAIEQDRASSLRFLKRLNDESPPLYKIFREISERLPGEIQLDGINFLQGEEAGILEVLAVTKHRTPWDNKLIFTTLMSSLDGVQSLECKQDPNIAMLHIGEEKLIRIKVTCRTTLPQGGGKR